MRLNPAAFNSWLSGNIGQNVSWRKGSPCPCFSKISGAAIPGHPLCGGKGWLWDLPIAAKVGVNSSPKERREWAQLGQWEAGDVVITVPGDSAVYNKLGRFDRLELLNAQDIFKLMLTRGSTDRIFLPVISFSRVFWLDPMNINATIDGGLPQIDANGNLSWPNNDGPPNGTQYSIAGVRYVDFFVYHELPSSRNQHFGAMLPQKAWLKRWDLFSR